MAASALGRLVCVVAAAALVAGCTARAVYELPPMTPAAVPVTEPGRLVWYELVTDDPESAKAFYGELFGWQFDEDTESEVPYEVISHGGVPIGGIAAVPEQDEEVEEEEEEDEEGAEGDAAAAQSPRPLAPRGPAGWLVTMVVPDLDAQLRPLFSEGGILHLGPLQVQGRGRMAVASDPGGAMLVLLQPSEGAPPESDHAPGRWLWAELWVEKPSEAIEFYGRWVGYRAIAVETTRGPSYHVFARSGVPRAGLVEIPIRDVKPSWLPYVQVADVDATIDRAHTLGARLFARDDDGAILIDPTGAAIGVQEWHGEQAG